MPGKVNPTQQERWSWSASRSSGSRTCGRLCRQPGQFRAQRKAAIIINNFRIRLASSVDACEKLRHFSVDGTRLNRKRIDEMVGRSLMLVTALIPVIGYDKASAIAHKGE